ncbi:MAG: S1 RNA-binding domain-containing protein [Deltaproteobacteria bacterium]|nr:S1 RNA-binding domain-containing protein [Deltaproteobacteria bacterium]
MANEFNDDGNWKEEKSSDDGEFARMFAESEKKGQARYQPGDKVEGEILIIGKDNVFVSLGAKEGIIHKLDLADAEGKITCKVGDKLKLFVTQVRAGEIHVSPNPTSKNLANDLEDAFDMELSVEGKVAEVCNGGFRVQLKGKLAFCPISQMDNKRIEQPELYLGQRYEFKITKFEEGGRNIVVSRRKILDEEREVSLGAFTEERKPGDIVAGRVTKLEKFGAFIEIAPGLDGLAHVSELAWSRVGDPSEVLRVGQDVTAKILKIEPQEGGRLRISLSIKQAGAEPWDNFPVNLEPGRMVEGRVTNCAKFGAFVEIAPGLEGLIPLSEMSYSKRVMRSDELVKPGETVSVMIKEVDREKRRISLSLKDAGTDPWSLVAHKFPVGTIVKGKVERREAYGLFIKLDDGVTGLLPKSKAVEKPEFPFDKLRINDEVVVQVAELRTAERRISLQPPGETDAGDWKAYSEKQDAAAGGSFGTLGDKLKAAMEKKKK